MSVILETNICNQNAAKWKDSNSFTCETYKESGWCTASMGYGPKWNYDIGLFNTVSVNNFSALNCPECGCQGNYKHN